MNGIKPNFLEGNVQPGYYASPNPYVNAPPCHVNLLELSRYAKKRWIDFGFESICFNMIRKANRRLIIYRMILRQQGQGCQEQQKTSSYVIIPD